MQLNQIGYFQVYWFESYKVQILSEMLRNGPVSVWIFVTFCHVAAYDLLRPAEVYVADVQCFWYYRTARLFKVNGWAGLII